MGKEYTIFIDSGSGTGVVGKKKYMFDWNLLEQGEYEMSFTFLSPAHKELVAAGESSLNAMVVEAEVPFSSNRYKVASTTNSYGQSSNAIGFIETKQIDKWTDSGSHFSMRYWASKLDNPTIKLYGAPSGSEFTIHLRDDSGLHAAHPPATYNMILKLKHMC